MRLTTETLETSAPDGSSIQEYTISNASGMELKIISFGATIVSVKAPNINGKVEDIALCYPPAELVAKAPGPYFGATIGRYANRIAKGIFTIDGHEYRLDINNYPNSLHGGKIGFNMKIWRGEPFANEDAAGVNFYLKSPNGDENYPGELDVCVTYMLTFDNKIIMEYKAMTTEATIVNLTNHSYWNLSGNYVNDVKNTCLLLSCDHYLPVDDTQIPTGEIADVAHTPFDFRNQSEMHGPYGKLIGSVINHIDGGGEPGLDHCFVINDIDGGGEPGLDHCSDINDIDFECQPGLDECFVIDGYHCSSNLRHAATLTDTESGRQLVVRTTQPGIQVYTSNFLSKDLNDFPYTQHNAVALETQHYPNSINQSNFPSVLLRPGEEYYQQTVFQLNII